LSFFVAKNIANQILQIGKTILTPTIS